AFLLEHLPPQIHLVIASRTDPPLPLARLRGRGELAEIRAADLRFTPGEVAAYLNEVMGLALTAADVAALEGRTEGWIAALQLAALSMQGREDVTAFIDGFAGDDGRAADLVELAIPAMRKSRQEAAVLGWLEVLPDEVVRVRPVLSVGFAGALLAGGEFDGVEARLRDAERWLGGATGIRQGSP